MMQHVLIQTLKLKFLINKNLKHRAVVLCLILLLILTDNPVSLEQLLSGVEVDNETLGTSINSERETVGGGEDRHTRSVTPQMLLVCCWRTMKEISMLLGYIAQSLPLVEEHGKSGLISAEQVSISGYPVVNVKLGI